jgi:ectoine hydroxylase-related dioxygenase (phytanoyl-CoA dioxygenase family)
LKHRRLTDGFEMLHNYIEADRLIELDKDIADKTTVEEAGIRHAEDRFPSVRRLAESELLLELAESYLGAKSFFLRAIYFNKTATKNWLVPWHQDKTVATKAKAEVEGWGPWSLKEGVNHVQPPLEILEKMVSFRVHLDDAGADNACLKVIGDSHRRILNESEISDAGRGEVSFCTAARGDVLAMQPLIVHASSKATKAQNRRVIHLEYGAFEWPVELI